jgi:hypothetical protein
LVLSLLLSGCGLAVEATRVVALRAHTCWEDHWELHRNRQWAEEAWASIAPRMTGVTQDYADGFKSGFAEYLYHGPSVGFPITPSKYRDLRYQTPAGYAAIEQWYAGYRHGEIAAESGGYRRLVTGPPPPDFWPVPATPAPAAPPAPVAPVPTAPVPTAPNPLPSDWRGP